MPTLALKTPVPRVKEKVMRICNVLCLGPSWTVFDHFGAMFCITGALIVDSTASMQLQVVEPWNALYLRGIVLCSNN